MESVAIDVLIVGMAIFSVLIMRSAIGVNTRWFRDILLIPFVNLAAVCTLFVIFVPALLVHLVGLLFGKRILDLDSNVRN